MANEWIDVSGTNDHVDRAFLPIGRSDCRECSLESLDWNAPEGEAGVFDAAQMDQRELVIEKAMRND